MTDCNGQRQGMGHLSLPFLLRIADNRFQRRRPPSVPPASDNTSQRTVGDCEGGALSSAELNSFTEAGEKTDKVTNLGRWIAVCRSSS